MCFIITSSAGACLSRSSHSRRYKDDRLFHRSMFGVYPGESVRVNPMLRKQKKLDRITCIYSIYSAGACPRYSSLSRRYNSNLLFYITLSVNSFITFSLVRNNKTRSYYLHMSSIFCWSLPESCVALAQV